MGKFSRGSSSSSDRLPLRGRPIRSLKRLDEALKQTGAGSDPEARVFFRWSGHREWDKLGELATVHFGLRPVNLSRDAALTIVTSYARGGERITHTSVMEALKQPGECPWERAAHIGATVLQQKTASRWAVHNAMLVSAGYDPIELDKQGLPTDGFTVFDFDATESTIIRNITDVCGPEPCPPTSLASLTAQAVSTTIRPQLDRETHLLGGHIGLDVLAAQRQEL